MFALGPVAPTPVLVILLAGIEPKIWLRFADLVSIDLPQRTGHVLWPMCLELMKLWRILAYFLVDIMSMLL